mgnify:FL=1
MTIDGVFDILKNMRTAITSLLIISFFGLAVFGFANMAMVDGHGHADCIANAVQGTVCPEAPGTIGFINFHAGAIKFFSTAVFGASVLAIFAMFLALALATFVFICLYEQPLINYRLPQFLLAPASLPKETLNHWLTLHEKRDPVLSFSFR